ncbi:TetR/AcrR family transcriptional regulator [Acetobacterium tundrae]|uniref:TetR family transcriptional regulator n=1 Tax=Acetobacterium tundrae TaxID=132932 RepID=A0ABR6WKD8_9FIRM|nr:TetR/AcrR family transcriptional regulator [Acetobacterium tundrae]MBC3796819.1 TetR family transcriptional regulator [Acetobacterium tundrae]
MRISKEPEVRKQEMIDTAMKVFARKGYEATSMTDIAKEMNVVSGLCYRYFKSKHELYEIAVEMYAKECSAPVIQILTQEGLTLEGYIERLEKNFITTDGKEKYHDFFHQAENVMFHQQLELKMLKIVMPHMINFLENMKKQGEIQIDDTESVAKFILYGQMPIINDETITTAEKVKKIDKILKKILS